MIAVIPMAGRGSRYATQGYEIPKPLIEVAGKPMVLWALKSLSDIPITRYVVITLKAHDAAFNVCELMRRNVAGEIEFVLLDQVTEGQLSTVLAAQHLFNGEEDILISASDTLVESRMGEDIRSSSAGGLISVADLPGDQWSFARTDETGNVVEVAEKKRISGHASTGLYYFRRASDLIRYGQEMIRNHEKTRGEYYVIPVYQKMIKAGIPVGISMASAMWDMGTPEAKNHFEKNYPS